MSIRKITLTNANGVVYNLNDTASFFESLSGFGYEKKFDTELVGENFIELNSYIDQIEIRGTIKFDTYAKYNDFIKFAQFEPIIMKYEMPGITTPYYIDVKIQKIEKKEIEVSNLNCPISFISDSHFYKTVLEEMEETTGGKIYSYTYNYTYRDNASGTVVIQSDSAIRSPIKIIFNGQCFNPSWSHYINDELEVTGRVECTVNAGEKLIIDTTVIPYSIKKFDSYMNLIEDCYQKSDFTTKRFVLLGFGENKLNFFHEGTTTLNVTVDGRIEYASV